jgi:hypothetical protein
MNVTFGARDRRVNKGPRRDFGDAGDRKVDARRRARARAGSAGLSVDPLEAAIVDAVNSVLEAKQLLARPRGSRRRATLRVIECTCSDEAEHRRRLQARRRPFGFEPSWCLAGPVLVVDVMDAVVSNVSRAREWISAR